MRKLFFAIIIATYLLDCLKYPHDSPMDIDRVAFLMLGLITNKLYFSDAKPEVE